MYYIYTVLGVFFKKTVNYCEMFIVLAVICLKNMDCQF